MPTKKERKKMKSILASKDVNRANFEDLLARLNASLAVTDQLRKEKQEYNDKLFHTSQEVLDGLRANERLIRENDGLKLLLAKAAAAFNGIFLPEKGWG